MAENIRFPSYNRNTLTFTEATYSDLNQVPLSLNMGGGVVSPKAIPVPVNTPTVNTTVSNGYPFMGGGSNTNANPNIKPIGGSDIERQVFEMQRKQRETDGGTHVSLNPEWNKAQPNSNGVQTGTVGKPQTVTPGNSATSSGPEITDKKKWIFISIILLVIAYIAYRKLA